MWVIAACGSALFAGLVAILGKLGVQTTDSDVATAVRTCVVLVLAWVVAACAGSLGEIAEIQPRTWLFLVLSGLATGGSWICYFKALSLGDVNKVVPIDKSSAVLASLLAIALFAETSNLGVKLAAIAVILAGTLMMIERKDVRPPQDGGLGWLAYAVLAALFAALTAILGKVGIDGVESNLGTAIRTCVVLAASWGIVTWKGKLGLVRSIVLRAANGGGKRGGADRQAFDCRVDCVRMARPGRAAVPQDFLRPLAHRSWHRRDDRLRIISCTKCTALQWRVSLGASNTLSRNRGIFASLCPLDA